LKNSGQVQNREIAHITEQTLCKVPSLSEAEAGLLEALGRELRGMNRSWAGNEIEPDTLDGPSQEENLRSVIRATRRPGESTWSVFVNNAIGVIGVNDLQIIVEPKIPNSHFDYLASWSIDPSRMRLAGGDFQLQVGFNFLSSLWISFLDALAVTLKADLHHDYLPVFEDPPFVRGRIDLARTYVNLGRGKFRFPSTYDELSVDNPVNRILKAASFFVNKQATNIYETLISDEALRQRVVYRLIADRAREAHYQLSGAGEVLVGDLEVDVTRLAVHQQRAFELGKQILTGIGRSLEEGDMKVSCYLYPTPPVIESGIRNLLASEMKGSLNVTKRSRTTAKLKFNPDLVLESNEKGVLDVYATGDVKYRIRKEDWPREVLEQAIVFAEVFCADHGFFVDFSGSTSVAPSISEKINSRYFHRFSWPAHSKLSPEFSAEYVVTECQNTLGL